MKPGLTVWECAGCDRVVFPRRLLCPECGAGEWRRRSVHGGVVEEATIVRRAPGGLPEPSRLGTVRLDGGPPVVARLAAGASAGMRVRLGEDDGVPVALPPDA